MSKQSVLGRRAGLKRGVLAAGLTAGLGLAAAPAAFAHDSVVGGSPADGEVVQEFPDTLTLDFSGEVQDGFNTFALSRADNGEVIADGEPTVEGRQVSLDLPDDLNAEPGEYRIGYQIISSDGHATKGMTSFTYSPAGQAADATTAAAPASQAPADGAAAETANQVENQSNWTWLWALLGVLVVVGVAAAAFTRTRQSNRTSGTPEDQANVGK